MLHRVRDAEPSGASRAFRANAVDEAGTAASNADVLPDFQISPVFDFHVLFLPVFISAQVVQIVFVNL